jgi:SOS-response transcriptional repressor LexA
VIIGKDLIYRNQEVITDPRARATTDQALRGLGNNLALKDEIIRNTYKTLLTRGQKGCYIYCEDKALAAYIREQIQLMRSQQTVLPQEEQQHQVILESVNEEDKYISFYPVYSIRAACGYFGHMEPTDHIGWMKVDGTGKRDRNKFIVQAVGHSMEPRINDGDYCLFQRYQGGSREGKIVLAEHHGHADSEYEGSYSIKVYRSTKRYDEFGNWSHESIELRPLNHAYNPIVLSEDDIEEFCIVGEFVKVVELE